MKLAATIAMILTVTTANAQRMIAYQETTKFGTQPVTIRLGTDSVYACLDLLPDEEKLIHEESQSHKEYVALQYWQCGESGLLTFLSAARERDGDLIGAYAYMYAAVLIAKASIGFNSKDVKVRGPLHAGYRKELARLGGKLSADQRAAAKQQSAQMLPYIVTPL